MPETAAAPDAAADERSGRVETSSLVGEGHDQFELIFMMLLGIRIAVGKFAAAVSRTLAPQVPQPRYATASTDQLTHVPRTTAPL